jgi:3-phosphoshikimate 1-carboxyvinyltransferase
VGSNLRLFRKKEGKKLVHEIRVRQPKPFQKTIHVPGDKSISHRALILSAIAHGKTRIDGFLPGADCDGTIYCLQKLGVEMERIAESSIEIKGRGWARLTEPTQLLDVGNSGTTVRLLLGVLACTPFFSIMIGDESIARRPMERVVEPLRRMGAWVDGRGEGNYVPLSIRGNRLTGISIHLPIASAQVKSALLLAGLGAIGRTMIYEPFPSRDHTERMLPIFGGELQRTGNTVSIEGGQALYGTHVQVPGDLSSAAFLLAAALVVPGSGVTVENVGLNPSRTGILDIFQQMGARVIVEQTDLWGHEPIGRITISADELHGIEVSGEMIPRLIDEIPILAVVATQAKGQTRIRNAEELKVKETNRIFSIVEELRKLGAQLEETEDGMVIEGPTPLSGGNCHSHGDHRIAMAMVIAGLSTEKEVVVQGTEIIDVSFPGFFRTIQQLCE